MAGLHSARLSTLVAAGGASWEPAALRILASADIVVFKRCVDLVDLIASASAGQADAAVVAADLPGLDADALQQLRGHGVGVVAVLDGASSATEIDAMVRIGTMTVSDVAELPEVIDRLNPELPASGLIDGDAYVTEPVAGAAGRVIAVWGPTGAPGRTTVAIALAAERAATGASAVLLDVDPYGGAVGQHLGVLDEVSGLLAAARLAQQGRLDDLSFARCRRTVRERLSVVTGLPRPDRWIEVRSGVVDSAVALAARVGDVVIDTGFSIEDDAVAGPLGRNTATLEALAAADEVVLVGTAEPTGLSRLARSLVDLRDQLPDTRVRVVVNRMRDSLGWQHRDIVGMVEGYAGAVPVHFLPEDRPVVDRALVAGKSLAELGDSDLRGSLRQVADAAFAQLPKSSQSPVNV